MSDFGGYMLSVRFFTSKKGGIGEGGQVSAQGNVHIAASLAVCWKALIGTGCTIGGRGVETSPIGGGFAGLNIECLWWVSVVKNKSPVNCSVPLHGVFHQMTHSYFIVLVASNNCTEYGLQYRSVFQSCNLIGWLLKGLLWWGLIQGVVRVPVLMCI